MAYESPRFRVQYNHNKTVTIATLEGKALHVLVTDGKAWDTCGLR